MSKNNQQAFTILELMTATVVFSVILLLVSTGIIKIGNAYYKSVLQSRTQETARNIIDEISRGIQFSGEQVRVGDVYDAASDPYPKSGGKYGFCVNGTRYAYILNKQLATSPSGADQVAATLISYDGACNTFTVDNVTLTTGKELLGVGMRLTDLNIDDNGDTDASTFRITVGIASGEYDLLADKYKNLDGTVGTDGLYDTCKGGAGSQYCAVSKLSTIVQKRVK